MNFPRHLYVLDQHLDIQRVRRCEKITFPESPSFRPTGLGGLEKL
jgi:hypothetical protein